MPTTELQDLFKKYLDDQLTREEFLQLYQKINKGYDPAELDGLLEEYTAESSFVDSQADPHRKEAFASVLASIGTAQPAEHAPVRVMTPRRKFVVGAAAAAVIIVLIAGMYRGLHRPEPNAPVIAAKTPEKADMPPGHSGAVLTLANGKRILLDSSLSGTIGQQGGVAITKHAGQISYSQQPAAPGEALYNTMSTARGRQYQLLLADGTRVWLNAASSINFPASFTGTERRVSISGEVYFEVAKNKNMPFIVSVAGSEIRVLGTHFNVMSYPDENNINTTLLEGSVSVSKGSERLLLAPGEQASLEKTSGKLTLAKTDGDQDVAWMKGRLYVSNRNFAFFMRQISRWYDVDIIFEGKIPTLNIGGFIQRNVNLSTLLDFLKENGIHYRSEGKTIFIAAA